MNNRLHTYFDRTMVGRRDYFRQLIFLTFAPISILLFGLHLVGFYGLTIKPALACSTCYVLVSVVSLIVYIVKGPKRLKYIISAFVISLIIIQSVRLLILAFMGQHDPHAHDGQHNYLLYSCSCSQRFYITPNLARLRMYKYFSNRIMPISYTKQNVWSAAYYIWFYECCLYHFLFRCRQVVA